jgi:hypothetical protein
MLAILGVITALALQINLIVQQYVKSVAMWCPRAQTGHAVQRQLLPASQHTPSTLVRAFLEYKFELVGTSPLSLQADVSSRHVGIHMPDSDCLSSRVDRTHARRLSGSASTLRKECSAGEKRLRSFRHMTRQRTSRAAVQCHRVYERASETVINSY